jgi:hypothetical protein
MLLSSTEIDTNDIIRINIKDGHSFANQVKADETADEKLRAPASEADSIIDIQVA